MTQRVTVSFQLGTKIEAAKEVIRKAYEENEGRLFLSYSGGKDSTILRDIALSIYPDLPVVFSNTTNERKEVLAYVKKTPNVITVMPKMSFQSVIAQYGFPLISKENSQKINELKRTHGKTTRLKRFYGNYKGDGKLYKDPLDNWAKEKGLRPIIALMQDESGLRKQLALYGKDDGKKIYPFLRTGFTEEDIWEYAETFGIRFAECYYDRVVNGVLIEALDRTGCEYCMFGIDQEKKDRFKSSRILTPKRYEANMKVSNNGVTFKEAYDLIMNKEYQTKLDLYGGITVGMESLPNDWDSYRFQNRTIQKVCPYCGSRKVYKDMAIGMTFLDTPDEETGRKRVIFVDNEYFNCSDCGGSYVNDLHLFDFRFNVTKRVIDYIYTNLNKKSSQEISDKVGISLEDVREILLYYRKDILKALRDKAKSIWLPKEN